MNFKNYRDQERGGVFNRQPAWFLRGDAVYTDAQRMHADYLSDPSPGQPFGQTLWHFHA